MKFNRNSPVYAFTTENIGDYFSQINFKNKKVLTVCASGDHLINAYANGAKEITCFDINSNAKYIAELKFSAIETLTFEDFKTFFLRGDNNTINNLNSNVFKHSIYKRFRKKLPEDTRNFFDSLYKQKGFDGQKIRESSYFNNSYDNNKVKIFSNPYLQSKSKFEEAKFKLKPFNWIHSNIKNLESKLGENNYDIILLSNISDYAKEIFPETTNYLKTYLEKVIQPLKTHLNPGGMICSAYIYDYRTNIHRTKPRTQFDNPKIRNTCLKNLEHRILRFPSVIQDKTDAIIIM